MLMFMLLVSMTFFVACSDDDADSLKKFTVQLTSKEAGIDFTTFTVTLTELRSGAIFSAQATAAGKASFTLPMGQYTIVAEDKVAGISTLYGSAENVTFSKTNNIVALAVKSVVTTLERTFVLDELFFNCSSNGPWDHNYYETYFTITNVSDRPLYADGLSFAICGDYNMAEDDGIKSAFLDRDSIVVSQLYTIPGDGRTTLVQPGKSLVIAHSAIDHTQGNKKPAARNLSGADFEVFVPHEYAMTVDNPEVTNLTVNYSMFQAFSWGYAGHAPMMIVRADTELTAYVKSHLRNMSVTGSLGSMYQDYLVIPTSWIVDGVEATCAGYMTHKVLPLHVDKSYIEVKDSGIHGGFKNQFVKRKAATTGYLQDTNDTANDFEVIPFGQKNYPKK